MVGLGAVAEGSGERRVASGKSSRGFRRGEKVKRVLVESPLMSEMGQGLELEWLVLGLASGPGLGLVAEPGPHSSEDGPPLAERMRRS